MKENLHSENSNESKKWKKEPALPSGKESFSPGAFEMLFTNSPGATFICKPTGQIMIANAAACHLFGYTAHEFCDLRYSSLFEKRNSAFEFSEKKTNQKKAVNAHLSCIKKNGDTFTATFSVFEFKDRGFPFLGMILNEVAGETDIEVLMNNTEESFLLVDKNLNITSFNKRAREYYMNFFDIPLEKGRSVLDYAQPERKEIVREIYKHVFDGKREESMVTISNGQRRILTIIFNPLKDEQEEIIGAFITARDITKETLHLEELEKTKVQLDKIMSGSLDIICKIANDDTILQISAASEPILGYRPDELTGKNLFDFLYPEDLEKTKEIANNVVKKKGNVANYYNRYRHKNGSLVYLEWTATWHEDEKVRYGIARNVTEKILSEQKLLQSEKRFKSLVQDGLDLIGILDAEANYQYVSPTSYAVLGYLPEEFIDKNAFDFIHPDDRERVLNDFNKLGISQKLNIAPFRFQHKNGTWRWVETTVTNLMDEPAIRGIVANSRDITQRKLSEDIMLYERQEKEALINATDDLIWSVSRDLKLIAANKSFIKNIEIITGNKIKAGDEILLKEFPKEFLPLWQSYYNRALQGESFMVETYSSYSGNNSLVWTETAFNPIYQNQEIIGIACYSRDITSRKTAEELIIKSEARLIEAQAVAKIGSWETDLKTLQVIWSGETFRIFEIDPGNRMLTHLSFLDYVHPGDKEAVNKAFTDSLKNHMHEHSIEHRIITGNGLEKIIEERWKIVRDENGEPIKAVGTSQDISQRKEREEQLKLLESVIVNSNDAVIITEAGSIDEPGPRIIYVNEAFSKMTGYTTTELIGKSPRILQGPKSDRTALDKLKRAMQKKEHCEITIINYKKSGEEFYINFSVSPVADENGKVTHFISIERDVTEQKNAEETIRSQKERYDLAAEATSDVIWDWNLVTNEVIRSKEAMKKLFGFTDQEGMHNAEFWASRVHPDDVAWKERKFKEFLSDQNAYYMDHEYRFKKADGNYAYIKDKGFIIRDEQGKAIRMIGAAQDITRLKENEVLLQQTNAELEKSAKELANSNKELEQFAYAASHDLQEPLRMVSSFLTQIEKKYESVLDEKGKKYIYFAIDGAKRMRQIILDLLEYSKVGMLVDEEQEVDLNGLMQEIHILFRKQVQDKKATISYENLPALQANKTPIRQVFQNLVANALLYARENIPPQIKVTAKDKLTYWEFAVADNGIGINKEYFEKIFILFQRLHSREHFAGTGMGLALTKKIIENMGGKIWLKSVEGKGSTFYFTLPKK